MKNYKTTRARIFTGLLALTALGVSGIVVAGVDGGGIADAGIGSDAGTSDAGNSDSTTLCVHLKSVYKSPVGTTCKTSSGHVFERVEAGWKDIALKLTIFDEAVEPDTITPPLKITLLDPEVRDDRWLMSQRWCKTKDRSLISREQFEALQEHHFLELLTDMAQNGYWASNDTEYDSNPIANALRSLFNGTTQSVMSDVRDVRINHLYDSMKVMIYARCAK